MNFKTIVAIILVVFAATAFHAFSRGIGYGVARNVMHHMRF